MVCWPAVKVEVLIVVLVTPLLVLSVPWPILAEPSKKVTVPVGFAGPWPLTVAVKVTVWPNTDGLAEETSVVVVAIPLVTTWVSESLLPWKLVPSEKVAVMTYEPTVSTLVENVAVLPLRFTGIGGLLPMVNATDPVGVRPVWEVTVAVKVTS